MGTKDSCKTAAVMGLLSRGKTAAHIQAAQPPQARGIEAITAEILDAKRAGGEAILTIGRGLIEAKALLPRGEWLPWLEERVEFSEKAAQRFMKLAREYSNPTALSDLGATKALMLLALPPEQREEFIEATHVIDGEEKTVVDMTSRELERAIKERDAARLEAEQARAEQSAAEAARAKASQDMALANERLEGLNAQLEEQLARGTKWQKEIARLEADLAGLRARPVDVAVETDTAAVEAARREAEAAMQAQLDEAKAAAEQARAELMEANSAAQRAKLEQEDARRALEEAKAEAAALRERAEKKTALAANEDLVLFRTLFDQAQEQVNKLGGVLMKFRAKDAEKAQGLARALLALADRIREVAEQ